jgi:PEP-CTERM motif
VLLEGLYQRQPVSLCLRTEEFASAGQEKQLDGGRETLRRELPNQMRTRIFRSVATFASLLLLVAVPAQASPIQFKDIVNVMGDLQRGGQIDRLRLRVAQDPNAPQSLTTSPKSSSSTASVEGGDGGSTSVVTESGTAGIAPSLVAGTEVASQQQQADIQVSEQADVDGTICDCGEIPPVGGGFPKWPFLALIPLICVTGICHHHHKVPPPTPTPTPPVPEPASLLLFGSGIVALSAGARRRYARLRATKQAATMLEE